MDINRKTAFEILSHIEEHKSYSNIAANKFLMQGQATNPAFVRELVYGVLENKIFLDHCIEFFLKTPIRKVKARTLVILRMGVYQLSFMDSVPAYAAINESVSLAKKFCKGQDGFINGVLRAYTRKARDIPFPDREKSPLEFLSVTYSYEPWIPEYWVSLYGFEFTEKLLAAGNQSPPLTIRPNLLKTNRDTLKEMLDKKGFVTEKSRLSPYGLHVSGSELLKDELYQRGFFSVQDESSMLDVSALGPLPGELVLDVCAAPGGKSFLIAELMENSGCVISCDIYDHKLELIRKGAERLGIEIIQTLLRDGRDESIDLLGKCDRVLVDVPCSGLGVLRRKPEMKYGRNREMLNELAEIQGQILENSSLYVKPGGILVYSTCTISHEENEGVSNNFLNRHLNFEFIEEKQFFPNEHGTDGFYYCKIQHMV